ncbi:hypothetical protein KTD28_00570 [Burkholderia gladioli]|uniref:hypothetical protein n=1 Tax=Burkholderia gladioli TaxID=28095 RepID=UPI00163EB027|nr:hypothetical protein [Burkholderia gladioli]MBU9153096.1 hypothetical protein [Burkholderia gladioli]
MKKILAALAAAAAVLSLAACAGAGTGTTPGSTTTTPSTLLAKLKTAIVDGCSVVQPTLESVAALDPAVSAVADANGLFCTAASSITITSAQSLVDTGVPAVIAAVNASAYIQAAQKPVIVAAIGLFGLTVKNAIAAFNSASAAAVATSASTASAPAAASQ